MLSALVANLLDADLLLILSDVDGVYTDDPRCNPQAQRIPEIPKITEVTYALAGDSNTRGTGGMFTKIQAADLATRSGIAVVIASGYEPDIIRRVLQGEQLGTRFFPTTTSLESRKRWILAETVRHSCIVIDDGATDALTGSGKSLLSAGIMAIEGEFGRGQTVRIYSKTRREIARGLVRYNSSDLQLIKGLQSTQIADILGYHYGPEIVHRDDMVIL